MKITYITLDPLKYPRISKIAATLNKRSDIQFHVMIPKIRLVWRGNVIKRATSAVINYVMILMQILFVRSDVYWVANCPDILVLPLILRRKHYVLEYRSPWSIEIENEFGRGPWVYLSALLENISLQHAFMITLTTSKLLGRVKNAKPVFVIPNYPLESFGATGVPREEFRRRCGLREESKAVLFVGKLSRIEGVDLLPNIMEDVVSKSDNVVFWLVGDGPLYPFLKQYAIRFPRAIKLFGWQPHKEIPNFIASSDVCIAPRHKSQYSAYYNEEGLQKISEYMYFQKHIVACGIAESKEYLLVDKEDMAPSILQALKGKVDRSKRKTWEDYCEKKIDEMLHLIKSGTFFNQPINHS
jgi:glycosyltransferase involved in cell wall biosynthesis